MLGVCSRQVLAGDGGAVSRAQGMAAAGRDAVLLENTKLAGNGHSSSTTSVGQALEHQQTQRICSQLCYLLPTLMTQVDITHRNAKLCSMALVGSGEGQLRNEKSAAARGQDSLCAWGRIF